MGARGASVLLEVLRSEGVRYVFGNPGTTELPLMDALLETPDISYIWALQEASVVAMADGYAHAARRPGFINLHTAGGLGHGLGNLFNASVSGTPLVVTAGQQDSRHTVTDPLLFGDLVRMARPVMKWAQEVTSANQIPILVRRAFHDCNAAPDRTRLSLAADGCDGRDEHGRHRRALDHRQELGRRLAGPLADYLVAVEPGRLIMIAGDEVSASDAAPEACSRRGGAGRAGVRFLLAGADPVPDLASALGRQHADQSDRHRTPAGKSFDCIFALGGKSLITVLYTEGSAVPGGCDVFQMSADVRDLGRTYPTKLSVVGDIKASLNVLIPILREKLADRVRRLRRPA